MINSPRRTRSWQMPPKLSRSSSKKSKKSKNVVKKKLKFSNLRKTRWWMKRKSSFRSSCRKPRLVKKTTHSRTLV
jgi:hypothetical protein